MPGAGLELRATGKKSEPPDVGCYHLRGAPGGRVPKPSGNKADESGQRNERQGNGTQCFLHSFAGHSPAFNSGSYCGSAEWWSPVVLGVRISFQRKSAWISASHLVFPFFIPIRVHSCLSREDSGSICPGLSGLGRGGIIFLGRCPRLSKDGPLALKPADGHSSVPLCSLRSFAAKNFAAGISRFPFNTLERVIQEADQFIDPGAINAPRAATGALAVCTKRVLPGNVCGRWVDDLLLAFATRRFTLSSFP